MNNPKPLCRADHLGVHLLELAAHYRIETDNYTRLMDRCKDTTERTRLLGIVEKLRSNGAEADALASRLLASPLLMVHVGPAPTSSCTLVIEDPTVAPGGFKLHESITLKDGTVVQVPALDHDALMSTKYQHEVHARGRVERRLIAALVQHLDRAGFDVVALFDGDCRDEFDLAKDVVARSKDVMELVFNLDECSLRVLKKGIDWEETREEAEQTRNAYRSPEHGIHIVLGNSGWDSIADWNYYSDDRDGFNAAMESFDCERFA
jgi:hypothetical protein